MSPLAIVFMVLTMGGVVALNALCIAAWLRGPRRTPNDAAHDEGQR